jgi:hypothetical protein
MEYERDVIPGCTALSGDCWCHECGAVAKKDEAKYRHASVASRAAACRDPSVRAVWDLSANLFGAIALHDEPFAIRDLFTAACDAEEAAKDLEGARHG